MSVTPANIDRVSPGNKTKINKVSLKVSPDPSLRVTEASKIPHQALLCAEPFAILGADRVPPMVTTGVSPDQMTCFGPRGGALMKTDGPLWICDTGHHRLLGWKKMPTDDNTPADWVIGQKDFSFEGRNGKTDVSAASVNVPTGICACGDGMAIADA